jgi:microcystin-dependent protein
MSEPFLGELKIISWNFPPKGWSFCNGQLLPINQNQALFSILGTTYGGDGQQTFALPNLQGRMPVHVGNGIALGQSAGETTHTLNIPELPAHNHVPSGDGTTAGSSNANTPSATSALGQSAGALHDGTALQIQMYSTSGPNAAMNPGIIGATGGSQPHENMSPYLVLNVIIALQGIFPSRN